MKPEIDQILGITAGQIMGELVPLLPHPYAQGTAAIASMMLTLSAQEYDRAADIRVAENRDMRMLFAELFPLVDDAKLKARLEEAAYGNDASLKISALNRNNYALRELLIALHEHIEALSGAAARTAETRIWTLLEQLADRRQLSLAPG